MLKIIIKICGKSAGLEKFFKKAPNPVGTFVFLDISVLEMVQF